MTKAPKPTENSKKQRNTRKPHHFVYYTAIADRLMTVSWSNNSHPTAVVKPVYGAQTFTLAP